MTGIGEAAGVPASTISRLMRGRSSAETVAAVADALRVTEKAVLAAAKGMSLGPWEPPLEAHLLTDIEREALSVLIRGLAAGREEQSDAGKPPKKSTSGAAVPGPQDDDPHDNPELTTDPSTFTLAARHAKSRGKVMKDQADAAGEETQDDERGSGGA